MQPIQNNPPGDNGLPSREPTGNHPLLHTRRTVAAPPRRPGTNERARWQLIGPQMGGSSGLQLSEPQRVGLQLCGPSGLQLSEPQRVGPQRGRPSGLQPSRPLMVGLIGPQMIRPSREKKVDLLGALSKKASSKDHLAISNLLRSPPQITISIDYMQDLIDNLKNSEAITPEIHVFLSGELAAAVNPIVRTGSGSG